jgi:uncharacterized protein (TIGR03118 family)
MPHYYEKAKLVTNAEHAPLVNPWGLVVQEIPVTIPTTFPTTFSSSSSRRHRHSGPTTEIWVADNGSGKVTHYSKKGKVLDPIAGINVPSALIGGVGRPTGLVYNPTNGFPINGVKSILITVTEDGLVLGWNPAADPNNFIVAYTSTDGANYKSVEIVGGFLYATDFANGKIDTFNSSFVLQPQSSFPFTDPEIPIGSMQRPFGIELHKNLLYVTYADTANGDDELKGAGYGTIDVYDPTNGAFVRRLVNRVATFLNAPWGITSFSCNFADGACNEILVGNFGDGTLNIFRDTTGAFVKTLKDKCGNPLLIPGIWGIERYKDVVYYVAGGATETTGELGIIFKVEVTDCACKNPCK